MFPHLIWETSVFSITFGCWKTLKNICYSFRNPHVVLLILIYTLNRDGGKDTDDNAKE